MTDLAAFRSGCHLTAAVQYYVAMYARVNLAVAGSTLFAVLAALPAFAAAEDSQQARSEKALERRWIPAFGIKSGVFFQTQESSSEADCLLGGVGDDLDVSNCSGTTLVERASLREPQDDDMWAVSPYVGANVQLMSPGFSRHYPVRFFVSGEIVANFATSRNIASEGDPSGVTFPELKTALDQFPAKAFLGAGSRTTSQLQTLSWGADLGLVFPVRFQGRELRIKPSAGWVRFGMDIDGLVLAAVKDDLLPGTPVEIVPGFFIPCSLTLCYGSNAREVTLAAEDSLMLNAIGPGLELELDAGRFGSIGASLYLGAHVYRVLGDRSVNLSADSVAVPDGMSPDIYVADWKFKMDPWLYRASVGIRFHWLGF
jgi:hypothetical protein